MVAAVIRLPLKQLMYRMDLRDVVALVVFLVGEVVEEEVVNKTKRIKKKYLLRTTNQRQVQLSNLVRTGSQVDFSISVGSVLLGLLVVEVAEVLEEATSKTQMKATERGSSMFRRILGLRGILVGTGL